MKSAALIALIIISALIEAFGLPYLSLFRVALPLVSLSLLLSLPQLSKSLGIISASIAGLILDANSAGIFGLLGMYYLLFALVIRQLLDDGELDHRRLNRRIRSAELAVIIIMTAAVPAWRLVATLPSQQTPGVVTGLAWLMLIRSIILIPVLVVTLKTKKAVISI